MDQYQGVALSLGDQRCGYDSLAERCGCGEDTVVMGGQVCKGLHL